MFIEFGLFRILVYEMSKWTILLKLERCIETYFRYLIISYYCFGHIFNLNDVWRRGERRKCSSGNSYDRVYAGLGILLDFERCGDAAALHHIHRSYTMTCFIIFFFTLLILLRAQRVLGKFQTPVNKSGNWTRSVLWKGRL